MVEGNFTNSVNLEETEEECVLGNSIGQSIRLTDETDMYDKIFPVISGIDQLGYFGVFDRQVNNLHQHYNFSERKLFMVKLVKPSFEYKKHGLFMLNDPEDAREYRIQSLIIALDASSIDKYFQLIDYNGRHEGDSLLITVLYLCNKFVDLVGKPSLHR